MRSKLASARMTAMPETPHACAYVVGDDGLARWSDLHADAWIGLLETHKQLTRAMDAELEAKHGLSLSGLEVLGRLAAADGCRLRLSARGRVQPQPQSRIADRRRPRTPRSRATRDMRQRRPGRRGPLDERRGWRSPARPRPPTSSRSGSASSISSPPRNWPSWPPCSAGSPALTPCSCARSPCPSAAVRLDRSVARAVAEPP